MTPKYDAWNRALAARFLQEGSGQPLYLYTDDAVLAEVAGEAGADAGAAREAFVAAVRDTLGGQQPFAAWERRSRAAVPPGEPPSYLAVLCFLVLVAVEREQTHFSYYPGLNMALGRPRDAGAPAGFEDHVPRLFGRFNDWLKSTSFGMPTATSSPHFPHVSWPLSQALVRPSDRVLLVKTFVAEGLQPRKDYEARVLSARVRRRLWTAADSPSRRRLLELAEQHPSTFDDVVRQTFEAWDGTEQSIAGPQRINVRLCFDEGAAEWWMLGPAVPGCEGRPWRLGSSTGVVRAVKGFEASPAELWDLVGSGRVGEIAGGPSLHSPDRSIRWFSVDTRAGGWAEVATRDPDADQLAIVKRGASFPDVDGVEHRGFPAPSLALFAVRRGVPLPEVTPDRRPGQRAAWLEGGLPLRRATNTYLMCSTGLPDVVGVHGEVSIDGVPVQVQGDRVGLQGAVDETGDHRLLTSSGQEIRIRLLDRATSLEDRGPQGPGWDDVPPMPRVSVPCAAAAEKLWVVGQDGSLAERRPPRSRLAGELGLPSPEVDVTMLLSAFPFAPAFVVSRDEWSRTWVTKVPEELAVADHEADPARYDKAEARALVSALLVDAHPTAVTRDREWKRVLAMMMRKVQR